MKKPTLRLSVRMLCEGAVLVALAHCLGYLKLWRMPWGGSVSLIMLPLLFFALRWGVSRGLLAGLALGTLQFLYDGGVVLGWPCIVGDYLLAYTVLGLAGLFRREKQGGVFLGTLFAGLARFAVHFVVGATLWADYMPEVFLGLPMTSPWLYSLLYNGIYMGLNTLVCFLAFALLRKPLGRYVRGEDLP